MHSCEQAPLTAFIEESHAAAPPFPLVTRNGMATDKVSRQTLSVSASRFDLVGNLTVYLTVGHERSHRLM
jgi:hypothetical protein